MPLESNGLAFALHEQLQLQKQPLSIARLPVVPNRERRFQGLGSPFAECLARP
jgi:hypothetical protein